MERQFRCRLESCCNHSLVYTTSTAMDIQNSRDLQDRGLLRRAGEREDLFKAVLPLVLQAEKAEQKLLVDELKTVLQRYLEPLLG